MQVIFYKMKCEKIVLNKNIFLEQITIKDNVNLLSSTSINKPIISLKNTEDIYSANYAYISDFDRYYFITDMIFNNSIVNIYLKTDVLESFKNSIFNQTAHISRNEFRFNDGLVDDRLPQLSKNNLQIIPLRRLKVERDNINTTFKTTGLNYNITLSVLADRLQGYGTVQPPIGSNLNEIPQVRFSNSYLNHVYALSPVRSDFDFGYALSRDSNLATFVKSYIKYPFDVEHTATEVDFVIGTTILKVSETQTNATVSECLNIYSKYLVIDDFIFIGPSYDFKVYEPYTTYELYLPFVGYVKINANDLINHRLMIYYICNYEDGSGTVNIYSFDQSRIIYSGSCQLGIKIGVSSSNQVQNEVQRKANENNMYLGLLNSTISSVGGIYGIANGNPTGLITSVKGITSGINSVVNRSINNSLIFDKGNVNINSGVAAIYSPLSAHLKIVSANFSEPTNYAELNGKPLEADYVLNELNGYTEVASVHLEDIKTNTDNHYANDNELSEIETILYNGIIINKEG